MGIFDFIRARRVQTSPPGAISGQAGPCASLTRTGLVLALWAVLGCLGAPEAARAGGQIYSYTDGDGVTHFTNIRKGDSRFTLYGKKAQTRRTVHVAPARFDYDGLIGEVAREKQIPPALVKAVIAAESAFDRNAVSRAGAQGLMQLMPTTSAYLGVAEPFEPTQNIRGGVTYLRSMIDRYGDLSRALAAYNAGPKAVDRYGGIPPYRETRAYVDRVLTYYRHYYGDFAR